MVIAADYPFLDVFFTMILFFFWVAWIGTLIAVLRDVFRRSDVSGGGKAAWTFFLIVAPFLGVLIYLVKHGQDMAERDAERSLAAIGQFDEYVKSVAADSGPAAEIERANELLRSNAITQVEFDAIKAKALA